MAKRSRHPGVQSLGEGKYSVRMVWVDPKTGRKRNTKHTIEARSAAHAAEIRAAKLAELRAEHGPKNRVRLVDYATSWLASQAPAWKPSTRKTLAEILDLHVVPVLGDFYVDAIGPSDVVRWRDAQSAAPESVNGRLRVLRRVLRDAANELDMGRDPAFGVKALRVVQREATDKASKGYTPEELRAVLTWIARYMPQWHPLVATLAFTGLRFGEASALKWEDIDLENGVIVVRRAQWKGMIDSPKARASRRTVVIPAELARVLGAYRKKQIAAQPPGLATGFVFLSNNGNLLFQSVLTKPIRAAQRACGTRELKAAHAFRHSLNNLLRQVTDEMVRRALVGHADSEVGELYSHVGLAEKRAAINAALRLVPK
jgi:integrase